MKPLRFSLAVWLMMIASLAGAQSVRVQRQAWLSINSTVRLTDHWGFMLDLHERRNQFLRANSFHFARAGAVYWIKPTQSLAGGYASLWLAPATPGWKTFSQEHRIYQQAQIQQRWGRVHVLQRLRTEQRWTQRITNDVVSGSRRFTGRYRYLLSLTIPVSKHPAWPKLALANEVLIRSGREARGIFDQNRWFVGIRQTVDAHWSFDLGYMQVYQQKLTTKQFDRNHTFRWFWYYSWSKKSIPKSKVPHPVIHTDQGE